MEPKTPDIVHIQNAAKVSDLEAETIAFWRSYAGVEISPDDAREMIENLSGFFMLLNKWDRCRDLES